MFPKIL